ncbi:hypothetical protein A2688_01485 [Candidatus Daviesbacteria bacterium RIFCSPHIGHO2_01_FULL_38_8]|nr:MAG: hypothetical protein A2688_01485 [Candidatus Daviesbacteria bacterium RIFCSPHIGHO2_01_FULL_38_8]
MLICTLCNKKSNIRSWSRHKKGSSGASEWPLRAQISKKIQRPNLHIYKGNKYCTKCLRIVKPKWVAPKVEEPAAAA